MRPDVEPLRAPEWWRRRKRGRGILDGLPIVGAGDRLYRDVRRQLKRRGPEALAAWSGSGGEAVRAALSNMVVEHFGWPNPWFVPDDPCELLLLDPGDGLSQVEFVLQLEGDYGLDFMDYDTLLALRFGELVELSHARRRERRGEGVAVLPAGIVRRTGREGAGDQARPSRMGLALVAGSFVGVGVVGAAVAEKVHQGMRWLARPGSDAGATWIELVVLLLVVPACGLAAGLLLAPRRRRQPILGRSLLANPGMYYAFGPMLLGQLAVISRKTPLVYVELMAASTLVVCAVGWLPTVFGMWLGRRRQPAVLGEPVVCAKCGYNLTGNVSGRCPECGTQVGK